MVILIGSENSKRTEFFKKAAGQNGIPSILLAGILYKKGLIMEFYRGRQLR